MDKTRGSVHHSNGNDPGPKCKMEPEQGYEIKRCVSFTEKKGSEVLAEQRPRTKPWIILDFTGTFCAMWYSVY